MVGRGRRPSPRPRQSRPGPRSPKGQAEAARRSPKTVEPSPTVAEASAEAETIACRTPPSVADVGRAGCRDRRAVADGPSPSASTEPSRSRAAPDRGRAGGRRRTERRVRGCSDAGQAERRRGRREAAVAVGPREAEPAAESRGRRTRCRGGPPRGRRRGPLQSDERPPPEAEDRPDAATNRPPPAGQLRFLTQTSTRTPSSARGRSGDQSSHRPCDSRFRRIREAVRSVARAGQAVRASMPQASLRTLSREQSVRLDGPLRQVHGSRRARS
jgi:hypothetical protein